MKNITLVEISKKAGVSRQLVSAILNPKEKQNIRFSEESENKVLAIAEKYNYRKNRNFNNLLKKRHGTIGILGNDLYSIYSREIQRYILKALENDYLLTFEVAENSSGLPLFIRESVVDGIIMFQNMGEKINTKIKDIGIPSVHVNSNISEPGSIVNFDDYGSMFLALDAFVKKNRTNPALICSGNEFYNLQRIQGLKDACKKQNITQPIIFDIGSEFNGNNRYSDDIYQKFLTFLNANPSIDSVILEHSCFAIRFYEACNKLNRRIKDDISVIAIHDEDMGLKYIVKPNLTTLGHEKSISEVSINLLCDMIKGAKKKEVLLKYKLLERDSI